MINMLLSVQEFSLKMKVKLGSFAPITIKRTLKKKKKRGERALG